MKAKLDDWGEATLAAFLTNTAHEIVTQANLGGRTTYQNAGATRRNGGKASWTGT